MKSRHSSASSTASWDVLVVDDDVDLRSVVCDVLDAEGYGFVEANDGDAALEYLRTGPTPGLIFLDVEMPGMNGWEFCEVRSREPSLAAIPVVILSSVAGRTRDTPYAGVVAVLEKPFTRAELLDAVLRFGVRPGTGTRP